MTQTKAGIRELKTNLSTYIRQVEAGQAVIITRRGKPVGRIVPLTQPTKVQLGALRQAGLIAWNNEKLPPLAPVAEAKGDRMVSDLLLEDRE
jgi:prevent-host-death family protein